jgi:hypothetical protein
MRRGPDLILAWARGTKRRDRERTSLMTNRGRIGLSSI